ncbi:hypothetical protein ACTXT7_008504 [Hymenolepis weldensis]
MSIIIKVPQAQLGKRFEHSSWPVRLVIPLTGCAPMSRRARMNSNPCRIWKIFQLRKKAYSRFDKV